MAHLDLYRLAGLGQEDPGLLEDYLGPQSVAFVEWPEEGSPELGEARMRVTLTHLGGDRRRIEVCDPRAGGVETRNRCEASERSVGEDCEHTPGGGGRR